MGLWTNMNLYAKPTVCLSIPCSFVFWFFIIYLCGCARARFLFTDIYSINGYEHLFNTLVTTVLMGGYGLSAGKNWVNLYKEHRWPIQNFMIIIDHSVRP